MPDATAHFGIPECLHLLLNAILEIITNKHSMYKYVALNTRIIFCFGFSFRSVYVDTLWKGRNVLSMVAAGCFFLLYLIMGGFCIVWWNRYLVKLGEVLGSFFAVVVCVIIFDF